MSSARRESRSGLFQLVGRRGIEPRTNGLKIHCSTG
jgi:hypothetical protein